MTQHLASRELDDLLRQAEQPIFGFWWGVGFGVLIGVWIGYNFAGFFSRLKSLTSAVCDLLALRQDDKDGEDLASSLEEPTQNKSSSFPSAPISNTRLHKASGGR